MRRSSTPDLTAGADASTAKSPLLALGYGATIMAPCGHRPSGTRPTIEFYVLSIRPVSLGSVRAGLIAGHGEDDPELACPRRRGTERRLD